jgi:transposase-like protein
MARRHRSTPGQRAQWVSRMIADSGAYGLVSHLSREAGVSRQTLYAWAEQGRRALEQAFRPAVPEGGPSPEVARQVLTLLVEAHPSERGIRAVLGALTARRISLGAISAIIRDAEQRALAWLATHTPPAARPIALDEMFGNDRRGAYLHIVDTASYAVWAAAGPLPVDAETWTLVLWEVQARGLRWHTTVTDGGGPMDAALRAADPDGQHGRDVWHVLHVCAQVQGRLDRAVARLEGQTATVERQAARLAAGQQPRGPRPRTDVAAHAADVAAARRRAEGVRYLSGVLRELLEVVVVTPAGVLDAAARHREVDALLALLGELAEGAPAPQRQEIRRLHRHVTAARPGLLAFVPPLDRAQRDAAVVLGDAGVALVAWAWQRRAILGPTTDELVAQLPGPWHPAARALITAWASAVRASSPVENWHSILRPHLAVHRALSPGLLALLAVWHNHRVFTRGAHRGSSPLHLSGITDAPTDWLDALGYPPVEAPAIARLTASPLTDTPTADLELAA